MSFVCVSINGSSNCFEKFSLIETFIESAGASECTFNYVRFLRICCGWLSSICFSFLGVGSLYATDCTDSSLIGDAVGSITVAGSESFVTTSSSGIIKLLSMALFSVLSLNSGIAGDNDGEWIFLLICGIGDVKESVLEFKLDKLGRIPAGASGFITVSSEPKSIYR